MSRFLKLQTSFAVLACCMLNGRAVYADEPNDEETALKQKPAEFGQVSIVDAEPPDESLPKKRAVPDYDGRGDDPTTVKDALLWVPRVLLAPLYLATEYLVRRPIGAIIMAVERDKLVQRVLYIFRGGKKRNIGFSPTLNYDQGLQPAVGAYVYWDEAGSPKNHVRAYFATWGSPLVVGALADRWEFTERSSMSFRASLSHRSDNLFYGLGPDATRRSESRFEVDAFEAGPSFDLALRRGIEVSTRVAIRDVTYGDSTCCDTPGLFDRVRAGRLPPPPRLLDGGYTSLSDAATIVLDSRERGARSGARVSLRAAPSFDVSHHVGASWLRYDANAAGYWDVTGTRRVLSLQAAASFVDPLQGGSADIPFTELVSVGGLGPMRGFLPGRLIDRSAAVATLAYEWPVWTFLDGTIEGAVGNVFGAGLRGFEADKLRMSAVFGIRSNSSPDHQFELLTGFGTDTFEQGARATSFRLAFGATRGF